MENLWIAISRQARGTAVLLLAFALPPFVTVVVAKPVGPIVARVNDRVLTRSDYDLVFQQALATVTRLPVDTN